MSKKVGTVTCPICQHRSYVEIEESIKFPYKHSTIERFTDDICPHLDSWEDDNSINFDDKLTIKIDW